MSVSPSEASGGPAGGMLGPVNAVMGAIFDAVEAEVPAAPAEPGTETPDEVGAESTEAGGAGEAPAVPDAPADGDKDPAGDAAAGATEVRSAPPVVTADDRVVAEKFADMAVSLDERFTDSFEQQAIEEAQADYPEYIDMLQLHPYELIGKDLPSIDGTDQPVSFSSAAEVEQWQGAVRAILQRTLEASVTQKQAEANDVLDVIHASIQLFHDNPDLVPGSKSYNKQLASEFVRLAEPYALKMNGKLTGYSIPVQGLVDQVRARLKAAPAATAAAPAKKAAPGRKPQAGVPSKAGSGGGQGEDFSPMWKALGIDSVPI